MKKKNPRVDEIVKAVRAADRERRLAGPRQLAHQFVDRKKQNNKRAARGRSF